MWGFCQNSTVQIFSSHSLNIDLVTYSECMVGKPCNFPLKLVFIQPGGLKGKNIWGLTLMWWLYLSLLCWRCDEVSDREIRERKEQRNGFTLHWKVCVRNTFPCPKPSAFVYRQVSTRRCQRYKWFMESIYRASTWPSQSIYYVVQEATGPVWMNFIVLPQRSNSINAIKLLNPLALTKLGNRQMDL